MFSWAASSCWLVAGLLFGCAERPSRSAGQQQPVRRAYLSRAYSKTATFMPPAAQPLQCTAAKSSRAAALLPLAAQI